MKTDYFNYKKPLGLNTFEVSGAAEIFKDAARKNDAVEIKRLYMAYRISNRKEKEMLNAAFSLLTGFDLKSIDAAVPDRAFFEKFLTGICYSMEHHAYKGFKQLASLYMNADDYTRMFYDYVLVRLSGYTFSAIIESLRKEVA